MKKNNSLKKFNKLAKRVYKISQKRKLGWKWQDAQKWTSANLFQQFKGLPISKIKVTEVDAVALSILDGATMPIPKDGGKKAVEVCFDINQITNEQTEDVPFYYLYDRIFGGNGEVGFDDNLKIAVEIDGYISTGVIKKFELSISSISDLIKSIRSLDLTSGEFNIIFKRILISEKESERNNPCNGYILITMSGSSADINSNEVDMDVKKENLSPEQQAKIDEAKRLDAEAKELKLLKQKSLGKERPKEVEPKPIEPAKATSENRETELRKVLEILKEDFKDGILTKKQYLARQKQILDKFEKGGKI